MLCVILDTNIIISGIITDTSPPAKLLDSAMDLAFDLVTSETQIEELKHVTRRPSVKPLIVPAVVGRFVHDLRRLATVLDRLPTVERSPDANDNFLLGMAEAGAADYLVSGDKRGVLALSTHGNTRIVRARTMLEVLGVGE